MLAPSSPTMRPVGPAAAGSRPACQGSPSSSPGRSRGRCAPPSTSTRPPWRPMRSSTSSTPPSPKVSIVGLPASSGVLDGDHALPGRDRGREHVEQGRLAGPGGAWDRNGQMPVDQRLCAVIPPARLTTTGKQYPPANPGALKEIPAHQELCVQGQRRVGASQLPGGSTGDDQRMGNPATVGPQRSSEEVPPLHLHRHAFVTPHMLDRSGWFATAAVAGSLHGRHCLIGASRALQGANGRSWPATQTPWPR
jgi:hypothetical protein